jgi:hypothetical protein
MHPLFQRVFTPFDVNLNEDYRRALEFISPLKASLPLNTTLHFVDHVFHCYYCHQEVF